MKKGKNLFIIYLFLISSIIAQDDYSLRFDGVDDYISTASWFSGVNNDYSILVNMRINQSPDENEEYVLIHRGHFQDKRIAIDANTNTIYASDRNGQGVPAVNVEYSLDNINIGQWYSVAFTANTDSLKLYIDGIMVDGKQRTFGDSNWSSSHMFSSLGGGGGYGGDPNINISSISIWDSELTKAELQSYRFSDLTGNENNISSYWNFNEGSGSLVADLVSGNNGTVNGATWSENVPVLGCTYQYADNYNANANVNADCEFEQNSNSILYTVNPGGNTLTDYELLFELPAQDEMTNDYSDILFVDSFNNVLSSYISEYDENSAKVWVKLDTLFSGSSNSILCFYGESSFSNPNDPFKVFTLYENFDNGSFYNTWTVNNQNGASQTFENGTMKLNVSQTDEYVSVDSEQTFDLSRGYALEIKFKSQNSRGHFAAGIGDGNSKERTNSGGYAHQNGFTLSVNHDANVGFVTVNNGSNYSGLFENSPDVFNNFQTFELIKVADDYFKAVHNNNISGETSDASKLNEGEHPLYFWANGWDGQSRSVWFDEIKVRKIANPLPSVNNIFPVASNISATIAEDTDLSGTLSGSDADGDVLTYAIASNPSNGTVALNSASDGTFTYSPTNNYNGTDSFTYTASDGTDTSDPATVTITITSVIDKYYIAGSGSDNNNGSSNLPFATIQAGINASEDNDTIFVAAGAYTENINFNGKTIYLKGAEAATTILDGGQNGNVVQVVGGEGSGTTIEHFTLQNGLASNGGGVLVNNSSSLNLLNVIIKGNSGDYGAGISVSDNSSITIKNGLLYNNQSSIQGGALFVTESSQITALSSTIAYNSVSGNAASASGNGVAIGTASSFTANSSILWGNTGNFSQINIPDPQFGGSASISYSNIGGGWYGTGNVNVDPYFTDSDNGDFTLEDYSSLIGLGASSGLPATDLAGNARPNPAGSSSDIGVYENENASSQRAMAVQNLDVGGQEDLQHISDHTPLISFDYSDNASQTQTSYQVQVSSQSDFSDIDMWDTGEVASSETSTTYAGTELLDGATYHIRAKVSASDFASGWATTSFRLNSTVAVGNLTFNPEYNEFNVYTTVEFPTISSSPSADSENDDLSVKYILSTNSSFTNKVDSSTVAVSSSTTSWQPSIDPSDNQQYWVKASTYDGHEYGLETDASTFILNNENDAPDAFALSAPVGGAEVTSLNPVLDWPDVNDVDPLDVLNYTLYLDTPDPGITTIEIGTASTYEISTSLDDNTTYYWKVKATDAAGLSRENTGGYQSFRVNTENDLPAQFSLLAPENTSMVTDLTPTLLWNEPTDADDRSSRSIDSYSVYIGTDNAFTDVTPIVATSNNYTPSSNLTEDVLYYWKVIATDDDGGETTSATWSFWTNSENSAPAQFTLTSPEEGDETELAPTFTWAKSGDDDLNDELSYTLSLGSNQSLLSDIEVPLNSSSDNYSLSFAEDAAEVFLVASEDFDLSDDQKLSISAYVKVDGPGEVIFQAEQSFGYYIGTHDNGEFSLTMYFDGFEDLCLSTTQIDDGEWHHVAGTYSGSQMKIYVDGVLENTCDAGTLVSQDESTPITIGTYRQGSSNYQFNGLINKLSLWNDELSLSYLQEDIASFSLVNESALVGYWSFNEGSGSTLTDLSGNGNNGTINGAFWSNDAPSNNTNSISYTSATNLTDNTEYYWQVTAEDQSGATYTTPLQSFVVNAENDPPSNFTLLSPGNTTMVTDLTPEFHWDEPTDADLLGSIETYDVYISTDNSFADVTPEEVSANTYTVSADLTEDALYYWKVVATDDDGGETSSATWSFWTNSINSAPAEFTLVSPEQDEETGLTPTFNWTESSDADLYDEIAYTLSYGTDPSDLTEVTSSAEENYSLSFDGNGNVSFPTMFNLDSENYSLMGSFQVLNDSFNYLLYLREYSNRITISFRNGSLEYRTAANDANWDNEIIGEKSDINTNQWYTWALVKNNSIFYFYVDGQLDGEIQQSMSGPSTPFIFSIANPSYTALYGNRDNYSVWDISLTPEQIQYYLSNSPNYNNENLIGFWNFNEGCGQELIDLSGNGSNGIIDGATWSTDYLELNNSDSPFYISCENFSNDTEYHWQVTAEDQSGATYTTPLQSFVVNAENDLPSDFDLLSPGNTTMVTDLTPVLHWDEPTDADLLGFIETYDVYISTDNSFADVTPAEVSVNTYTVSASLTEDALYYWKVVATDDDGGETSSATWSFWTNSINSVPAEFTLIAPEQDEETSLTPTFSWNESSDADLYDEVAYTLSYGIDPSDLTDITHLPGENNYSLLFNGSDSYIEFNNIESQGDFSFLGYINFSSADASSNVFINGGGSNFIRLDGAGENWKLGYNSSTGANHIGDSVLPLNEWVHVAVVRENEVLSFYIDGQLNGTFDEPNNLINFSQIGYRVGSWDGLLDEFSIWGIALSQAEVQQYLESFPSSPTDGLLAAWTFDEGEGLTLADLSGNQNNGTLVGPEWSDNVPNAENSIGDPLSTSFTPSEELRDDTEYHWQVIAEDLSGATFTTPLQSFVVNSENQGPGTFALSYPDNESMVVDLTPTLTWESSIHPDPASYIDQYQVYLSTDDSFEGVTADVSNSNSFEISSTLDEDELYYWKVIALDEGGDETSSSTWSFWTNSVNSTPAEFTLVSPEQNEETSLRPTFSWNESSDTDLYDEIAYKLSYGANPSDLTVVTSSSGESSGGGYSLSFDGIDDYVFMDFLSDDIDNSSVTLMGWFKSTSNGLPDIYYEGIMGFRDYPQSDGNFFATMNWTGYNTPTVEMYGGASVNIPLTPDDGTWYHLAMTYDGIYTTSFLNGILINTVITENDPIVPSIQLLLGNNNENGEHHFKGLIDDVSLWSIALNSDEIQSYMTGSPSENQNNLVGYWNFNQGSGEVLTDLSGNGNDGVIVGATWSTDVPETGSSGEALSGTSYTPLTDLTDDTEYHWQVTAEDQSGATYTTPLRSFVVNAENDLPSDFDLLSPDNTTMVADLTPVLHWDEPTDADLLGSIETYDVYIGTDNSFSNITPGEVSVNTYTVSTDLTEDALYYWKVVAKDDDGGETTSATWSFWTNSINSAPAEFTLISPEQDEETGLTPTFSWNESSDADLYDEISYTLSFGTDPSGLTDVTSLSSGSSGQNYSLSFDGVDDYVSFESNIIPSNSEFTIEIEVLGFNEGGNREILSDGSGIYECFYIGKTSDGKIRIHSYDENDGFGQQYNEDVDFPFNEWTNLTVVNSNQGVCYFINGARINEEPFPLQDLIQGGSFQIGRQWTGGEYWSGNISQIKISNTALYVDDYNIPYQFQNDENTIALWTMNEGSGDVLTDFSGNGNNGTILGAEWSNDVPDIGSFGEGLASTSFTPDEDLLDNTRYHWQVTAEDLSGATFTTPLKSFIVNSENDLPSDFALISPDSMAMVTDLTPTLHWQEPTDADERNNRSIESYDIYLGTDDSFNNVSPISVSSNYYEVGSELDENASYFWKVVAIDDDGGETTSNTWIFWTNNENSSPDEFTLLTPEEGEETILTPTFTWTESTDDDLYDAIGYTLKYGTDPTDLDLVEPFEAGVNVNYSLSFDGEDDYIMMENFQIPDPYLYDATIELWFKSNIDPQSFSEEGFQGAHLFKKSGLYEEMDLRLFEDSLGFEWESNIFGIQEGVHMLQSAYNDANWHHYAVQISDDLLSVFLDGVNVHEEIVSEDAPNFFDFSGPFNNLLIGVNSDQQSSFFKGLISEMKISSVAQYSDNFNPDSLIADESTVSLWKFNANSGDVLYDLSGNENHGAIYGDPTWTTDVPALYGQAGLIVGTSYTTEFDLSDNTRYYWQVTATDLSGATYETEIQSFIVNLENDNPDMFSLLAPENTSMIIDLTPTFYWEVPIDQDDTRSRSIENYFIYYGTGIEDLTVEMVNSNSFTVLEPLIEDTTYFWKVVARDDDGGETQTETWSFWTNSVNSSPTDFILLTPEENQDVNLRPTFSWTESNDIDLYDEVGYIVQIGTDPFNLEDVTPPSQIDEENFSVEFDGQDDLIEIGYFEGLDISENYTWIFDVQFYDINSNAMLIENNSFYNTDGYYINYVDGRVWFSLCSDGTCYQYSTTENNFLNDIWYNIQIVKLDGVMSIYVDGVNVTDEVSYNITPEEDISQYYVSNTESLIIGLNTSGDPQPFSGKIDRLSLWGMALDEMQVEYYYTTSPSGLEEGIIGYWNFNQGDGDIVSDISGNENNASLNGTVWVQEEESDVGQNDNITYYLPQDDLMDNTEYYWQVTAFDQSGATSSTPMQSFFVNSDNDNPTGFTLQSPDSGSFIPNSSEILLFWDLTTDIDGDQVNYELYFGNTLETMELVDVVGVNYYEMQNLIEETYFWSVTAFDDLGGSASSPVWSFEVVSATNNAPLPFSILSPSNGGQSDSLQVELTWEPTTDFDLGDTVSYQVEFGESINSLISIYNGTETVFTTEELLDNTTYFWRVLARDLNGAATENNGGIFTFTVNTENDLPSDFALLLPENGAVVTDLTPTFMWEEPTDGDDAVAFVGNGLYSFNPNVFQSGSRRGELFNQSGIQGLNSDSDRNSRNSRSIVSYEVYIGADTLFSEFTPIVVEENNYTPNESLIEDMTYYWKVIAEDNDGGQTESIIQSFTTNSQNSAPSDFSLLTPFSDEEVDTIPVLFSWTESHDLDTNLGDEVTYILELGESIDDMETIYAGSDTLFATDQLLDNTNYFWRVLATDLNGAATENIEGIRSFMLNMENDLPGDFALFFPEDGSMVTDLTPTLMWEEPTDEDDAVSSFGNQIFSLGVNNQSQNRERNLLSLQSDNAGSSTVNSRSIEGYDVFISPNILFTDIEPVHVDSNSYTIDTNLIEDLEYYWKVVAIDDDGGQTESEVFSFWTNNQNSPPAEIILLTPERESTTGTRPLFSWSESSDDDLNDDVNYTFVYGDDVTSLVYVEVDDQLSHFTSDSLLDNTEYFWQVIAEDYSGATYTTPLQSFFVNAENDNPEGFALLSPDSGSVVQGFEQYLIWLPSTDLDGDTVEYEVFIDNQSIGVTNHNYMEVRDLVDDVTYEWYVIASDGIGGVATSVTWFFTVNAENNPPSEFSLLSPSDEALFTSTGITFNWQRSFDVDIYDSVAYSLHIQSEDTNMVLETGDTSLFIEDFADNQIYHWSVVAYDLNSGTTNNTGGSRMFIVNLVNDTPSIVGLMAPNEGSTQSDLTPNFAWTNSYDPDPLDAVSYNLSWWEPFSTDIQSVQIDSNGFTPNGYLMDNAIYQWRIKSEDLSGAASFSDTTYFYTDAYAEPPVNFSTIAPAPDANMSSTVVNFKWFSTTDPDPNELIKYRIAYSTDWSDTSAYVYTAEIEDTSMSILLNNNLQYFWVAQAIDKDNFVVSSNYNTPNTFIIGTLSTEEDLIPNRFALHQNFPNPFNPTTTIRYDLPNEEDVRIVIFDVVGRKIRSLVNQNQSAGYHRFQWDSKNDLGEPVSAGMYIYILHAGEYRSVKKMVLLK